MLVCCSYITNARLRALYNFITYSSGDRYIMNLTYKYSVFTLLFSQSKVSKFN